MAKQLGSGSAFQQPNVFTGATSQRLLGGLAQTSSGAPIADDNIGTPALSPQATPVNTFIQAGKAELGGKPFMFDRPATPPPNNDLANLAKALSGFNENLGDLGTYLDQRREQRTKDNQAEAQSLAGGLQTKGYLSFKEAIGDIGNKVQSDPSLLPVYNQLRAAWPETQSYVDTALGNLAIQSNIVSLPSKVNSLKTGILGTPINNLKPDSDEWKQTLTQLILPENANPKAVGSNAMSIVQARGAQNAAQLQRYVDAADEKQISTHFKQVSGLFNQLAQGQINRKGLQQAYEELEQTLFNSTTPQNFEKYKATALNNIGKILAIHSLSATDKDKFQAEAMAALGLIRTGQRVATGNQPKLIDSFGVPAAVASFELRKEMTKGLNEQRNADDQQNRRAAENTTKAMISETFTEAVMASPQKYQAAKITMSKRLLQVFAGNPELLAVANSLVNQVTSTIESARIAPIQQETYTREYEKSMLEDVATGKQRIRQLYQSGNLSQEGFNELNRNYIDRQAAENRLNNDVLKDLAKGYAARQKAAFGTSFYGDFKAGGISTAEDLMGAKERNDLLRRGAEIIRNGKGTDVTDKLEALYSKGMEKYNKAPGAVPPPGAQLTLPAGGAASPNTNQPQAAANPEQYKKLIEPRGFGYNFFGGIKRNTPGRVNELNREIRSKKLYDKNILIQQLEDLGSGKELDDATKLIIKSSTVKPSEFFFIQMRNHGMKLAPGQEQRLLDLDKSPLVSAVPPATNAYPGFAMVPTATPVQRLIQDAYNNWTQNNPDKARRLATSTIPPLGTGGPDPTIGDKIGRKLRVAIIGKESGGNYEIVNPDFGAIGIGQVLPENVGPWTAKHYGQRLTPQQYRYNRAAQDAVVHGQLQVYYDNEIKAGRSEAIAIRKAASAWYSGQPNLYDNNRPQYSKDRKRRYPSIREYTMDILRRVQRGI